MHHSALPFCLLKINCSQGKLSCHSSSSILFNWENCCSRPVWLDTSNWRVCPNWGCCPVKTICPLYPESYSVPQTFYKLGFASIFSSSSLRLKWSHLGKRHTIHQLLLEGPKWICASFALLPNGTLFEYLLTYHRKLSLKYWSYSTSFCIYKNPEASILIYISIPGNSCQVHGQKWDRILVSHLACKELGCHHFCLYNRKS